MIPVPAEETIWRRVLKCQLATDGTPTSAAFRTEELSVTRASMRPLADEVGDAGPEGHVYAFTVEQAVSAEVGASAVVEATPPDYHALVLGTTRGNVAKRLRNVATRVLP